ncbi:unnamed protein product [Rhizoctonia solani]|uniref:Uncharacterized protein n=2 Tax=Rhizoctonia solani TaxID=456999 RepID=A0A8H3HJ34_9AGAM
MSLTTTANLAAVMDVPAPATAHIDVPSGNLYWLDALDTLAKEFVVTKPGGNHQVHGSLSSDEELKGLQTAYVTRAPNHHLVIQWVKTDGTPVTTVSIEAHYSRNQSLTVVIFYKFAIKFTSTEPVHNPIKTTSQGGEWRNT